MATTYSPREMIEKLVSFDTTSRDSNLGLIHFVRDYLAEHGVDSALIHDETGEKANLFATVGPEIDGGVVLSGHTDVVPVDGQDWHSDPFDIVERDGRLYGRGTCDMKSFIAIALALLPEFQTRRLTAPIHFAFSYDEEVGCLGVDGIIRHIDGLTTRPRAVIVGEPTDMTVVNAHKSCYGMETVLTGLEAHSSATQSGVNTIFYAAELIGFIQALAEEMKTKADPESRFDPPYTTVHVGTIRGGTALNIIPKETKFVWEYRAVPADDGPEIRERVEAFAREKLLPKMRAVFPEADIITRQRSAIKGLAPQNGSPAESLVMALAGTNQTFAVSYGTEAGAFQHAGTPTVICGPGNIAQAHKPDEFIELSQVDACIAFMRRLGEHLSQS